MWMDNTKGYTVITAASVARRVDVPRTQTQGQPLFGMTSETCFYCYHRLVSSFAILIFHLQRRSYVEPSMITEQLFKLFNNLLRPDTFYIQNVQFVCLWCVM